MTRSVWKGLFIDNTIVREFEELVNLALIHFKQRYGFSKIDLLIVKKYRVSLLEFIKDYSDKYPIKIWSRRSVILPVFVGFSFLVYNGKIFRKLKITSKMSYHKFGEFVFTKRYGIQIHTLKRKKKLKKKKKR